MRKVSIVLVAACIAALLHLAIPVEGKTNKEDLVEMSIKGVTVHPQTGSPVVLLEAVKDKRELLIWIGYAEAQAIAFKMEDISTPRPMTHDLLQSMLQTIGAKVVKVLINDLKNNVFFATIIIERGRKTMEVDSRPSDAIALAVRARAPIYVTGFVLEQARGLEGAYKEARDTVHDRYGMGAQPLTRELAEYFHLSKMEGVLVSEIAGESIAHRAGLRRGDVIVEIDGIRTKGLKEFYAVLIDLEEKKTFSVFVIRDNDEVPLSFRNR